MIGKREEGRKMCDVLWMMDDGELMEEGRGYLSLCFPTELYSFHRLSLPKLACSARSHSGKFTILSCAILTRYILASIRSGVGAYLPLSAFCLSS